MNRFIEAVKNMFRIEDLRKRVLFTLALLAVYRIGAHIPTPGINVAELTRIFESAAGSALIMWLGEQISERGIGNGMSLIIFVGIVVGLPRAIRDLWDKAFVTHEWGGSFAPMFVIILIALMIAVVAFIVFVEGGQRRIPVQYAKRVVGRRVMGGQSSYLPLRVNSG